MKKKNLFAVLFVLAAAVFTACGSDDSGSGSNNNGNNDDNPTVDDNTPSNPHLMEGEWKAETFTFEILGTTYGPENFTVIDGCATDYLTILSAGVVELAENNKNAENECVDTTKTGSWTEQTVTISGEDSPREVISVNETTLTLQYTVTWAGVEQPIVLEYSRQ